MCLSFRTSFESCSSLSSSTLKLLLCSSLVVWEEVTVEVKVLVGVDVNVVVVVSVVLGDVVAVVVVVGELVAVLVARLCGGR